MWARKSSYLSNLSAYCSKANLRVAPKRGTAIMWYNHLIDESSGWLSTLDSMSYHGGCDVMKGHKWIVNNWINIVGNSWDDLRTWSDKHSRIIDWKGYWPSVKSKNLVMKTDNRYSRIDFIHWRQIDNNRLYMSLEIHENWWQRELRT